MGEFYKWEKRSLILQFYFLQWNIHITPFLAVNSKLQTQNWFLEYDTWFFAIHFVLISQQFLFSKYGNHAELLH